ncbi:RNAseL inhibitor family protein, putative [Entamoeba histolytica HM-1:IMSS-B]|uniref:RNAseL inhibitor-like protein, putative n=10 Tax=Entamoeba TaxID=5758 RepID=B1N3P0_ENTH1|nr:RNAseL inhibitor-like protein, putative [Entamoeba histolytica HM-1:IMSS]XP_008856471.1 RNAseL inhibitor family protein, putative [Entamoeba nuttalli P19]EMH77449.1 RNAseL inhibitor family protein, putative [Entamoeba histolytica HM-1:IMSS-B]EMS15355.1 RNAseL inhibitor family protein [Entamoeba histolytica HM-3:IMSS]ENY64348.1 RNAseL inhibitor family protein, putative [Entamoeba histolytica HM-1:IMSS-A]GAT96211.1 RNAsel inhibitor-like protein putative [Entamoeba histolytica]EDS89415.1 RNAs|eukprot:XP_008856471.1 RNAseL inhibitor family protein, putative [Entamoeba nuttalli P19]
MSQDRHAKDTLDRIAVINDRCKPGKCRLECKKTCPINRAGGLCIEVLPKDKRAVISETLCIGCALCVKKCPFEAIKIINLPKNLEQCTTHRYGPNSFKLHRLPMPRPGQILGLVGTNGIGKSTALKILAASIKPNLGQYKNPPSWAEIIKYYRGSDLQNYFKKLLDDQFKAEMKIQYVDSVPRTVNSIKSVGEILRALDERNAFDEVVEILDIKRILNKRVQVLSGGELQLFVIATVALKKATIYMFDEPTSYLDVSQRLKAAHLIRSLITPENYVIVVEHDLSVLDYMSDFIVMLYGSPGAYGVCTMPFSVREGINIFLDGFIPTENMRFREEALKFKIGDSGRGEETEKLDESKEEDRAKIEEARAKRKEEKKEHQRNLAEEAHSKKKGGANETKYHYPAMTKTLDKFHLTVKAGGFDTSEIIVLLGQNGTGKTTFIRLLAGQTSPDDESIQLPKLNVSYKPQKISPKFEGTVQELLEQKIKTMFSHPQFNTDVIKPLNIQPLLSHKLKTLSGGELQRVALVLCLGKPADVYLIDEPSAYLDSEQRIVASKVIKRFILHSKKTAFIVEHDFIMATYLADKVVVYEGKPAEECIANPPVNMVDGMNTFLKSLNITFRRDPDNYRPRINKENSQKDQEQKREGKYFHTELD